MIEHKSLVKVRFVETDAMGVVYHANYLAWCEIARVEMLEWLGIPYTLFIDNGFHLPVFEEHLNYKFPARFGDTVEICARIKEKPSVRIRVDYDMHCNGKLIVTGYTMHAFVNNKGMPVKPPHEFFAVLSKKFDGQ